MIWISPDPNQSFSWPLSRKNSRQPTPPATSASPVKSIGSFSFMRALMFGGSSTSLFDRYSDISPIGRLMKKIQCQLKLSVIQPPSVGPMAGATTTAMPYRAKAWPRLATEKVSARMACSDGASPPPPMPCRMRAMIRNGSVGARPHSSEQIVNSATQVM